MQAYIDMIDEIHANQAVEDQKVKDAWPTVWIALRSIFANVPGVLNSILDIPNLRNRYYYVSMQFKANPWVDPRYNEMNYNIVCRYYSSVLMVSNEYERIRAGMLAKIDSTPSDLLEAISISFSAE